MDYEYFQENMTRISFGTESGMLSEGWDYASCSEIEETAGALTDPGCQYAVELHYESEDGSTKFAAMLLAAPPDIYTDDRTDFGREVADPDKVTFHDETRLPDFVDEATGSAENAGDFGLLTVATTTSDTVDVGHAVEFFNSRVVAALSSSDDEGN